MELPARSRSSASRAARAAAASASARLAYVAPSVRGPSSFARAAAAWSSRADDAGTRARSSYSNPDSNVDGSQRSTLDAIEGTSDVALHMQEPTLEV